LHYYKNKFGAKFSLTLDIWTTSNQQNYMGITVHFIDKNWVMQSKLLDMVDLKENHTGAYLHTILQKSLSDFEIQNSIFRSVFNF
jgi:hypothetical protein